MTIGSSGTVTRSSPEPCDKPRFGVGPVDLSVEKGRLRAVVPLHITRAGALDPDWLTIEAAAYADASDGRTTFFPLQNSAVAWQTPPQKAQRDGTREFVIETDCPAGASGLCIRLTYADVEQFRILIALPTNMLEPNEIQH